MGGLANIIADSSYAGPNVGYSLPVSRGARTLLFTRVDGSTSIANKVDSLAGGVGEGTVVGTPNYVSGYIGTKGLNNFIASGSPDSDTSTILLVARNTDVLAANATTPGLAGNFVSGTSGYGCYFSDSAGHKFFAKRCTNISGTPTNSNANAKVDIADNVWAFLAAVFDDTAKMITVYNKTTGQTAPPIPYSGTHITGATNIRFGSVDSLYAGTADIAFAAEHNVALTANEIETIYQAIKAKLAAYPSPIVI